MRVLRSFFLAVSMYSKIPVPQLSYKEEDMKYLFCFFPWIGACIGFCVYMWNRLCGVYHIGSLCRAAVGIAVPVFLTGGFHADGFLDTIDAVHSYGTRERKLEILKDSHIGAFAVILPAAYGLAVLGAFSEIKEDALVKIVCSGFFLSRCLSGIAAVSFPLAKQDGMLSLAADSSEKRKVKAVLYLQSVFCIGFMLYQSAAAGLSAAAAAFLAYLRYYFWSRRIFGGITGDTAGYFVLFCEGCMIIVAAAVQIFLWR